MSMDYDPIPGLPLISELFCNVTKQKKKKIVACSFPDELYTKKEFYGGIPAIGLGFFEIILIAIFIILSIKMKSDITKYFLTAVYLPLGISSIMKLLCGLYGFLMGPYGILFMTFQMLFDMLYNTAVITISTGSIFYLAGLIIIARRRRNFEKGALWITFWTCLFASILLSSSYHFVAQKWNQLPAASIFFVYVLSTIAIFALLIATIISSLLCTKPSKDQMVSDEDVVVYDARSRLVFGAIHVLIINIPQWFELFVKQFELFTPYLWNGDDEKKVFYTAQRKALLSFDVIRLFLSLPILLAFFINRSSHSAIAAWIHRPKRGPNTQKVFAAAAPAATPLLAEKEKEAAAPPPPLKNAVMPVEQAPAMNVALSPPPPIQTIEPPQLPPPGYANAMSFSPGMLQFPQNMQTTIVYTPPVHQSGAM